MAHSKVKVNLTQLKQFQDKINQLSQTQVQVFIEGLAKELAARLIAKARKRTPVGVYPAGSGKVGGTLRRGWTIKPITKQGSTYIIEIINPTEYASYVEYGHRTRGGNGWVEGRFMLTISEQELEQESPVIIEKKLQNLLKGLF